MSSTKMWGEAKKSRREADDYIGLIGKTTTKSTLASHKGEIATAGKLSKLVVSTQVHFQPYDGANNYHDCKSFDAALSSVARKHWDMLRSEALDLLREQEREAAIAAKEEVEKQLAEINSAMSGKLVSS